MEENIPVTGLWRRATIKGGVPNMTEYVRDSAADPRYTCRDYP